MDQRPIEPEAWHAHLPRALLVSTLLAMLGLVTWGGARWVHMVEMHVTDSRAGYERIRALEVSNDRTAEAMRELTEEVKGLRRDLMRAQARRDSER